MISSSSSHTCTQTHTRILCPSVLFIPSSISLSSHSSSLETLIIPTIPRFISTIILFPLLSPLLSLFLSFLPSGATCWADCFFTPLVKDDFLSVCSPPACPSVISSLSGVINLSEEPSEVTLGVPLHFTRPWCSAIGSVLLSGAALPNPFSRDMWGESLCVPTHYDISLHVWCKDREQTAHDLMCQLGKDTTDCFRGGMYILV